MIPATVFSLFKFIAVVIILAAMVMLLLGIGHLSHVDDIASDSESQKMMREVLEDEKVIGDKSVFNKFLSRSELRLKGSFTSRRGGQSDRE